jgi:peptide/nickel transport system substrate-binding protein
MEIPDPLTYKFYLKKGVKFHDGHPLTAIDVKFTLDSISNPKNHSPYSKLFDPVESITIPSPYEIIFHLKEPFAPFLENLTIGILPQHILTKGEDYFRKHLVGSGPFRLIEYSKDSHITLERFPQYFAGPAKCRRLIFKIIPDSTIRILELIHGSVDIVQNDFPPFLLPWLEAQPDLKIIKRPGHNFRYLAFNLKDPILSNLKVRQAIAHAINRPELIKYKLKGLGTLANSLIPPDNWAFDDNLPVYEYNPTKARRLLDQAGYLQPEASSTDHKFRFRLLYKTSQNQLGIDIAKVIQRYLRNIGIDVKIRVNEFQIFFSDLIQGNFQLYCLTAPGVSDPDYFHYLYHSASWPPNGGNRVRYYNPLMDKLIDQGRITLSSTQRKIIYRQVQEIAAKDLPFLGLWHEMNVAVINKKVQGYKVTPGASYIFLKEAWKTP